MKKTKNRYGNWEKDYAGVSQEKAGRSIQKIKCPECGIISWKEKKFGSSSKKFYKCQICGFEFVITKVTEKGLKVNYLFSVVR